MTHSKQHLIRISIAGNSKKDYGPHLPLALRRDGPGTVSMWYQKQMMRHSEVVLVMMSIILIMVIM